jgi:hypothetical protein
MRAAHRPVGASGCGPMPHMGETQDGSFRAAIARDGSAQPIVGTTDILGIAPAGSMTIDLDAG